MEQVLMDIANLAAISSIMRDYSSVVRRFVFLMWIFSQHYVYIPFEISLKREFKEQLVKRLPKFLLSCWILLGITFPIDMNNIPPADIRACMLAYIRRVTSSSPNVILVQSLAKKNIPNHLRTQLIKSYENSDFPECCVCLEFTTCETYNVSTCGHVTCTKCIASISKCPVCRAYFER